MLTIWIIPFPVMVFSYFPVLVNEKSNLQIRIGYFAFLPSLDTSENPTKKQGKPKFNPTWIFDFFSSDVYVHINKQLQLLEMKSGNVCITL